MQFDANFSKYKRIAHFLYDIQTNFWWKFFVINVQLVSKKKEFHIFAEHRAFSIWTNRSYKIIFCQKVSAFEVLNCLIGIVFVFVKKIEIFYVKYRTW